ncbi:MAG: class I SAM-dependent methyltransferase [Anaerolineae bacterium]|nr:class I SAM-dependent methyltransferase [Anaerolineae bacterium]
MRDFYDKFYARAPQSRAHALFCERVFGRNLCQHGFASMAQIDALIDLAGLKPGERVLDLGCGSGMIAEYISNRAGAHVTGLDYVPEAIQQARARVEAAGKAACLAFEVGDINTLTLPASAYDAILSMDTLYFSDDLARTVGALSAALKPRGRLAACYSHGWEPGMDTGTFPIETLAPERTPLGDALRAHNLAFHTTDVTADECRGARARRAILEEIEAVFEADGLRFVWENRMGEARGITQGCELGLFRRYLYLAVKTE